MLAEADYVGSTQGMSEYVGRLADGSRRGACCSMTECSMADNVSGKYPSVEFVRPCNLCPHMKRNTLPKVLHSLEAMEYEVTIARRESRNPRARAVDRMLELQPPAVAIERTLETHRSDAPSSSAPASPGLIDRAQTLRRCSVTVLCKTRLGKGAATDWAQGGIAAAMGTDDSPRLHAIDTQRAGAGISDEVWSQSSRATRRRASKNCSRWARTSIAPIRANSSSDAKRRTSAAASSKPAATRPVTKFCEPSSPPCATSRRST